MCPLTCTLVTLCGYMDRTQMLSDPLEQSRLLTELPEVIADIEELDCIVQESPTGDRSACNSLPDSHIPGSPDADLGIGMSSRPTDKEELEPVVEDSAVDDRDERNSLPESHILQTLDTDLGIGMSAHPTAADVQETRNQRSEYEGLTSEERTLSVEIMELSDDEPCNVPETRDQRHHCEESASKERQRTLRVEVVELSDDEGDKAENGQQTLDNSISSLWYVMGPHGEIMGPKPMSLLKLWVQTVKLKLKYKVWEQGKRKEEAILLEDAIRRFF
ncbi:GYF domain containing protein [Trema orientale]|uniref:GYF domain containing protein n=1 Tax=Trema orientale TaxID=63057 RepID=A0A2P5E2W1_TREOI|nr:GYF domain containing protein [Trema orientale]